MSLKFPQDEIQMVAASKICVNRHQPRHFFAEEELAELAASIQSVGIIHPPVVRKLPQQDQYEIISGERRFRAAQLAGLEFLPVVVKAADDFYSAEAALIENIQRVDLNPIEIAKALKALQEQGNLTQEELARRLGKKRSTVANYLRLLSLPELIQQSTANGQISMGHAKAILYLQDHQQQLLLYERIVHEELTVREAEAEATSLTQKKKLPTAGPIQRDIFLEDIAKRLQERLGTKITLEGKDQGGKLSIHYYSYDDLDRILEEILGLE